MQEDRHSLSSHFVTLTYNNQNVPITPKKYMTLDKRHLQLFFKKLRKCNNGNYPIKYYICGEYGSKTKRPHYHAIIFNVDPSTIPETWSMGDIHIGQVSEASVGYTLKYMFKNSRVPEHKNDDRLPEFNLMSKGLGKQYLTDEMKAWHHADLLNRMHLTIADGKKVSMPRYYKDRLYTREQRGDLKAKFSEEYQYKLDKMLENPRAGEILINQIMNQKRLNDEKLKLAKNQRGN